MTQMTEGPYCLHVAQRKGSWKLFKSKKRHITPGYSSRQERRHKPLLQNTNIVRA